MIAPAKTTDSSLTHEIPRQLPTILWVTLFALLVAWVAYRAGAFELWTTVHTAEGQDVRLPVGYATVDHPFHAARAELLRRSLADGNVLRWIGSHQGGYPAEFYPLGVAGLDVALWALLAGALPMALVHKFAVILIFLAPGLAFTLAAKRDRLPLGVGLVALAAHVVVRGWWWSGGYRELVEWGLVTNVAAAIAALFALVFLTSYLYDGRRYQAALAVLCGSFAVYANPRSAIALVLVAVGAASAVVASSGLSKADLMRIGRRLTTVVATVLLVAALEILSLVRFEHLYYFVRYERYEDLSAYWDSSIQAVSGPVFAFGLIGLVTALILPRRPVTRAAAITLALYVVISAWLSSESFPAGVGEQLETTRLMPFQRLLTVFLGAVAVYDVTDWVARRLPGRRRLVAEVALVSVAAALPVLYILSPPSWIPEEDRGLVAVPTADTEGIADLEEAVRTADAEAEPGTALLILGSTLSWHSQLWAPIWSDRPFYYDDWLWYWQTRHVGPYDPLAEHAYDPALMDEVLDSDYLGTHGIGAVIVTETARTANAVDAIQGSSGLRRVRAGLHDVFLVEMPRTLVTFDGADADEITVTEQAITASGSSGGVATIRRNWFPRWRAWANGEPATITETDDGYMEVAIPPGTIELELRYVADAWDWFGRGLSGAGLVVVGWLLVADTRLVQRRSVSAATPRVRSERR